jgi:hypothetical protein
LNSLTAKKDLLGEKQTGEANQDKQGIVEAMFDH